MANAGAGKLVTVFGGSGFVGRHAHRDTGARTSFRRAFISIASTLAARTQLYVWVRGDDGGAPMLVADRFRCAQRLIIQDDSPAPPAMTMNRPASERQTST